ncbi:hypothetical protein AAGG49_21960, partial [Stenotrophomonas maltophilia]
RLDRHLWLTAGLKVTGVIAGASTVVGYRGLVIENIGALQQFLLGGVDAVGKLFLGLGDALGLGETRAQGAGGGFPAGVMVAFGVA